MQIEQEKVDCPFCAEPIVPGTVTCPHCGLKISQDNNPSPFKGASAHEKSPFAQMSQPIDQRLVSPPASDHQLAAHAESSSLPRVTSPITSVSVEEKACPYCAELIKKQAIKCKHCGSDLTHERSAPSNSNWPGANRTLLQGVEETILVAKLHWLIFFWPVFWTLLLGWFALTILIFARSDGSDRSGALFAWTIFLIPVAVFVGRLVERASTEFTITNKRFMMKTGMIARKTVEIPLGKIETVIVTQGLIGRLLGCGDLNVTGTGSSLERIRKLAQPVEFRDLLVKAMATARAYRD